MALNVNNVKELPTLLGKNLSFLKDWASCNEEQFRKVMDILAEEKPEKYADLYLRALALVAPPKEGGSKKIEVHHSLDTDIAKIQSLASMNVRPQLETVNTRTEYAEYTEVPSNSKSKRK